MEVRRVLELALSGDQVACVDEAGMSQTRVIQWALRLAADPVVALEHPQLVARMEAVRVQRRARRIRRARDGRS